MLNAFISMRGIHTSINDLSTLVERIRNTGAVDGFIIAAPSDRVGQLRAHFGKAVRIISESVDISKNEVPWHKFQGLQENFQYLLETTETSSVIAVHPLFINLSLQTIERALELFSRYGGVVFALQEEKDHPCQLKRCYQIMSTGYLASLSMKKGKERIESTSFPFCWTTIPTATLTGRVYARILDCDQVIFKECNEIYDDQVVGWRKIDDGHATLSVLKSFSHEIEGEMTGVGFPDTDGFPEIILYRQGGRTFAYVKGAYPNGLMLKLVTVSMSGRRLGHHTILATDPTAVPIPHDVVNAEGAAYVLLRMAIDDKYNHVENVVSSLGDIHTKNGWLVTATGKAVNGRQSLPPVYEISKAFTIFDRKGIQMLAMQIMPEGCRGVPVPWNELVRRH